jgi:hypothetical protein
LPYGYAGNALRIKRADHIRPYGCV